MQKRSILLGVLALVLVLGMTISSSLAYFTAYTSASCQLPITLGTQTTIEEPSVKDFVKTVVISNSGPSECYVRATAYAGGNYTLSYSGDGWTNGGDGFYYYSGMLAAGESTAPLLVTIGGVPADAEEGDNFHVVVVYESAMVTYDDEGNPEVADWSQQAVVNDEGGLQ